MDCIVVSDDENNDIDDIALINAAEQLDKYDSMKFYCLKLFFVYNSSSTVENREEEDELIALELEISELDQEINRLRHKRSQLFERQEKLKNTIKQNQRSTSDINLVEQWQRTGS